MAFRPAQSSGGKKKKTVRLKLMGTYVRVSRMTIGFIILGSLVGFFSLIGFLYWLWYIRIPSITG